MFPPTRWADRACPHSEHDRAIKRRSRKTLPNPLARRATTTRGVQAGSRFIGHAEIINGKWHAADCSGLESALAAAGIEDLRFP
jgi:hypothetical protein